MKFCLILGLLQICTSLLFTSSAIGQEKTNATPAIVSCWESEYKDQFDFVALLTEFEEQLQEKKILNGTRAVDYYRLFKTLNTESKSKDWFDVQVDLYVSPAPLKYCLKKFKPDKNDYTTRRWVYLFSIYHVLSTDLATIDIGAYTPDSISIDGILTNLDQFKQTFKVELDVVTEQNIPVEEVHLNIKIDSLSFGRSNIEILKEKIKNYQIPMVKYNFITKQATTHPKKKKEG